MRMTRPALVASTMYKHYSDQSTLSPTTTTGCKQRDRVDSPTEPVTARRDGGLCRVRRTTVGGKGDSSIHYRTVGPITYYRPT